MLHSVRARMLRRYDYDPAEMTVSILIDDTTRDAEGRLARKWIGELGTSKGLHLGGRGCARIDVCEN